MLKEKLSSLGLGIPRILLPSEGVDYGKWSVVACDQFTSDSQYWKDVEEIVGEAPSTRHLIFPEVYLEKSDKEVVSQGIVSSMEKYLTKGILKELEPGFIYIERSTAHVAMRRGLVVALDLEMYDFTPGTTSPIRPTEATVLERLPARIGVRRKALIDLPHILVLFDDPRDSLMGGIEKRKESLEILYDFDLMKEGGHIVGRHIKDEALIEEMVQILDSLKKNAPLLFAIGDGNHSLASAKEVWKELKAAGASDNHPSRYALVEIENIHDRGLIFEPIHRVLFNLPGDSFFEGLKSIPGVTFNRAADFSSMKKMIGSQESIGVSWKGVHFLFTLPGKQDELAAERLHAFLDPWLDKTGIIIDYIHGDQAYLDLLEDPANCGIYLPSIDKADFFTLIDRKGSMPRKTFSLGEAEEKRYYLESVKLS